LFKHGWLVECNLCGLVQLAPLPDSRALSEYYAVGYRKVLGGTEVADVSKFPRDNLYYFNRGQSVTDTLVPYIATESPRVLDIGAGWGHILHAMGERYPRSSRMAIEFGEACVPHLRSLGVDVFTQRVERVLPGLTRKLDVVVLSHVLEHLLDPVAVLRMIHDALVPGGILWIEVPNIPAESLLRYPDHKWAPRFDEPHVTFFSMSVLRRMVAGRGFESMKCDTAGPKYRHVSPLPYRMPPLRETVERAIPRQLFNFLRSQRFTERLRVNDREGSFYEEGGDRLWIRSVWRKRATP
jgi:SAM-dependent methyltransferase